MKCKSVKTDETECNANCVRGSDYCFSHNPDYSNEKQLAVTKGGLNRKLYGVYGERIEINSPSDIRKIVSEAINGVYEPDRYQVISQLILLAF